MQIRNIICTQITLIQEIIDLSIIKSISVFNIHFSQIPNASLLFHYRSNYNIGPNPDKLVDFFDYIRNTLRNLLKKTKIKLIINFPIKVQLLFTNCNSHWSSFKPAFSPIFSCFQRYKFQTFVSHLQWGQVLGFQLSRSCLPSKFPRDIKSFLCGLLAKWLQGH